MTPSRFKPGELVRVNIPKADLLGTAKMLARFNNQYMFIRQAIKLHAIAYQIEDMHGKVAASQHGIPYTFCGEWLEKVRED